MVIPSLILEENYINLLLFTIPIYLEQQIFEKKLTERKTLGDENEKIPRKTHNFFEFEQISTLNRRCQM